MVENTTIIGNEVVNVESRFIKSVLDTMEEELSVKQLKTLQEVLRRELYKDKEEISEDKSNFDLIEEFIDAKKVEGCSERTLKEYKNSAVKLVSHFEEKTLRKITTDDVRNYLMSYQGINNCSNTTIDNHRRNLSSFFSWLEAEDYILKSPMLRIHKIKTKKVVKKIISDEDIEILRDNCKDIRDLAIIDLLYSTGIRVGELVNLNKDDVDFENRECIVIGKGNKERTVYFDARTKLHLMNYLSRREDNNSALFVSLDKPYDRLNISGVEVRLRKLGKKLGIERIHPHKFRRTMATRAIDKGMPIEQVQQLLGHNQIDTTMCYAKVMDENVKYAHRKYIG